LVGRLRTIAEEPTKANPWPKNPGIHIVIDFNAFHCWCHVPGFISSMYNDAIASISISPRRRPWSSFVLPVLLTKSNIVPRVWGFRMEEVEVEARNAVAIARFYAFRHITHTTGWPMHLLKGGVGGSGGFWVVGAWRSTVGWCAGVSTMMIAVLCGTPLLSQSHAFEPTNCARLLCLMIFIDVYVWCVAWRRRAIIDKCNWLALGQALWQFVLPPSSSSWQVTALKLASC